MTISTENKELVCGVSLDAPLCGEERLAWLALALSPGLGPKRILDAMSGLKAASQIFSMTLTALEGLRFPSGEPFGVGEIALLPARLQRELP